MQQGELGQRRLNDFGKASKRQQEDSNPGSLDLEDSNPGSLDLEDSKPLH